MSDQSNGGIPVRVYRLAGIAATAELGLTTIHHAYGAIAYETPWRFHVAIVAPILAFAIVCALYLGGSRRGTKSGLRWTRFATVLILIFPVGLIGFVEGGYNHVVKDLVYFISGAQAAVALFPPPAYEMPNDLLFEATGIAQFPLGLIAGWLGLRILRRGLAVRGPASSTL